MATTVPQAELPILEAVINIRNRLTALKKNRAEYVKASDVNSLYQSVVKQVNKLNDVRDDTTTYNNRLDTTLADVFSLLSLFYLTIGKTKDTLGTYCQIASMKQILNHMNESAVYNDADLAPFHRRLGDLRNIIQQDKEHGKHPKPLIKLLERQLNECEVIVRTLQESLSVLPVELVPVHQKLVTIRRQLVALAAKEGSHKAELKPLQEELRKIESARVDGNFLGPGGIVPTSQALCSSLLEECFEISQEIKANEESKHVASSLKPIYDRLSELRTELESLVLTHRWTLRETDLFNYSLSLQEIDKMRVDGKFVDSEGHRPPGQYANKLSTVKKCLNEVLKYGGPFSPRDLYPYQLALFQIDSMRQDGKFIGVDGSIPEGQGILMAHLNECHELVEMLTPAQLKESMEEADDEDIEDDEDYDEDEESDEAGLAEKEH
ncbi:hypothetical protein C0995_008502 [Termitomyces sp. Mi166|nr:hypothetical protein C0995_008502 [Termitomyces sp. Mi166\